LTRLQPVSSGWTLLVCLVFVLGCGGDATDDSPSPSSDPRIWFHETASESGLGFRHASGFDGRPLFPEIMSGGVALVDVDNDGDLDLYVIQGGDLRAGPSPDVANVLYENDGSGRFTSRPSAGVEDPGYGMGVAAGDYDNDGDVDLYVTNLRRNRLFRNDGNWSFIDVTDESGVGGESWSTSASFVDYDRDGHLDLYVANYIRWSQRSEEECYNPAGQIDYCHPTHYRTPAADQLYRNRGDGTFLDVSQAVGLGVVYGSGMGVLPDDFDGDGLTDILVANDSMANQLWIGQADGTFLDEALIRGCALDEHGTARAGMGIAVTDLDEDLDPDFLVVNMEAQPDSLFRNEGLFLMDATGEAGLSADSRRFTRFGVGFEDFDNDGLPDLFQSTGKVISSTIRDGDPYAEPNALWRGLPGGRFELVDPIGGTPEPVVATGRAAAFGDVDGDGGVDVVVVNRDGPIHLFKNVRGSRGNWVSFEVRDAGRYALGATITLSLGDRRIYRTVRRDGSYCSSNDPRVHLGLGSHDHVEDVTIRWLDGQAESFDVGGVNRVVRLDRGNGTPNR